MKTTTVGTLLLIIAGCGSTGPSENSILPGANFVQFTSGVFEMGATEEEEGSTGLERPVHQVTIDYDFEITETEVTQGMWESVTGENPSTGPATGGNYPVTDVSWYDCVEFCETLSARDENYFYRLPTEAEWEYCCRAGTTTPYYWGEIPSYYLYNAWVIGSAGGELHPVAQLYPNDSGLYDICGGVYEWCEDSFHYSYEGAPADGSAWAGPGDDRIIRGGGWNTDPDCCRCAFREPFNRNSSSPQIGFRIVRIHQ